MLNARSILEIGTLGGYSTIWLARALPPEGRLVTLEADPKHASVARSNIARAGLASLVDVRVGLALDLLPTVKGPFDLAFLDADKINNANYFEWALRLSHVGSVIVIDNVVRDGKVVDTSSTDPGVVGVRRLNERIMKETRVSATTIQTVGQKGYDGFTLARVERP
jgi:predicted O-methyltransferase YrrM